MNNGLPLLSTGKFRTILTRKFDGKDMDGLKNASSEFFALFVIHSPLSRRSLQIITCKVAITKRTAAYPMSEQKLVLQRAGGARGIGGHLPPPHILAELEANPFPSK